METAKMQVPFVAVIHDRRGKGEKTGNPQAVEIRVTINRAVRYFHTGIRVYNSEWRKGQVVNRPDCLELNERISLILRKLQKFIGERLETVGKVEFAEIKELLGGGERENPMAFFDFCVRRSRERIMKESTRERYHVLLRNLRTFGRILAWRDVTVGNIMVYHEWLRSRMGDAGAYNYHKVLKALIADAVRMGKLEVSPYSRLPKGFIKKGEHENDEFLTLEEVRAIEKLDLATESLQESRDLFLMLCFTGMSPCDVKDFRWSDYRKEGEFWVFTDQRAKTSTKFTSILTPKAVEIIRKYGFKMPALRKNKKGEMTVKSNFARDIKLICAMAGIERRAHPYLSRHAFATIMLGLGVDEVTLARLLGHATTRQTRHYAKVLEKNVVKNASAALSAWMDFSDDG